MSKAAVKHYAGQAAYIDGGAATLAAAVAGALGTAVDHLTAPCHTSLLLHLVLITYFTLRGAVLQPDALYAMPFPCVRHASSCCQVATQFRLPMCGEPPAIHY